MAWGLFLDKKLVPTNGTKSVDILMDNTEERLERESVETIRSTKYLKI